MLPGYKNLSYQSELDVIQAEINKLSQRKQQFNVLHVLRFNIKLTIILARKNSSIFYPVINAVNCCLCTPDKYG